MGAILVQSDLEAVNKVIQERLTSDISLINTLASYIIHSGGKRLRPLILLLCARCYGYQGTHHIQLAAVVEFIHTATLLHDDVVDTSATRRGQPSANQVWGNQASVLVGDFLYSRAFEMMVETDNMDVMNIMATTTNSIAEGEVLQLMNAHSSLTTEQQYMDTIHRKTAKLFESATRLAGIISGQDDNIIEKMANFGLCLGTAFQLVDDVLDYEADYQDIGKDVGDDLAEGKPTLPLIYALQYGNEEQQRILRKGIERGDRGLITQILAIVRETGALDYTMKMARQQAGLARELISCLPVNPYSAALMDLAEFTVVRRS